MSDFLYDLLSAYSTYARPTPSRSARLPLLGEGTKRLGGWEMSDI